MEELFNFLHDNLITYVIRKSIKIDIKGNRDKSRQTICIGTLSDKELSKIMTILGSNDRVKKYILRRNIDSTYIIIGFDSNTIRYYLDNGIDKNSSGMISIETKEDKFNVKKYKSQTYNNQLDDYFHYLLPYLDINSFLVRSDGQMYLRVIKTIPRDLLNFYCRNEPFFDEVGDPVWFQFSDNSFTFYFEG